LRLLHVFEEACTAVADGNGGVSGASLDLEGMLARAPYIGGVHPEAEWLVNAGVTIAQALRGSFVQIDRIAVHADPVRILGAGQVKGDGPEKHLRPTSIVLDLQGLLQGDFV